MATSGSALPHDAPRSRWPSSVVTTLGAIAGFCAYFCMYAFRKPIAAAEFTDVHGFLGIDYKTPVIIAQVAGYAASKLIGVRVIALPRPPRPGQGDRRADRARLGGTHPVRGRAGAVERLDHDPERPAARHDPVRQLHTLLRRRRILDAGSDRCALLPAALRVGLALEKLPPPNAEDEAERTPRVPMDGADRRSFLREHAGALDGGPDARFEATGDGAWIHLANTGKAPIQFAVAMDEAYAADRRIDHLTVDPGKTATSLWPLARSDGWHDLTVTASGDDRFLRRYAGSIGNLRTDPAIGTMRLTA